MRPTLNILLLVLMLQACGPFRQMHKVRSQVSILGSIGKHRSSLFKKDFQKIGEPELTGLISVSLTSVPFSNKTKSRYEKYREYMGMKPLASTMDSVRLEGLSYYNIKIDDVVDLVEDLNQESNSNLKHYLQEDTDLVLLSSMSFVAAEELTIKLEIAEKLYLTADNSGALVLVVGDIHNGYIIKQSNLEIFDYEVANFCWNLDRRGHLKISHILMDGGNCPGSTESKPEKLNKTPDYLKL